MNDTKTLVERARCVAVRLKSDGYEADGSTVREAAAALEKNGLIMWEWQVFWTDTGDAGYFRGQEAKAREIAKSSRNSVLKRRRVGPWEDVE